MGVNELGPLGLTWFAVDDTVGGVVVVVVVLAGPLFPPPQPAVIMPIEVIATAPIMTGKRRLIRVASTCNPVVERWLVGSVLQIFCLRSRAGHVSLRM